MPDRPYTAGTAACGLLILCFGLGAPAQSPPTASFRGGPSHPGIYSGGGAAIAGLQWRFLTNGEVNSSAAVVGNALYIGSGDGHLYALDRLTGSELWRYDARSAIASSPAIAGGLVIFGSYDGHFFAVDARSGALRWRLATGALLPLPWGHESGDRYTSSPTTAGSNVVFGAGDGQLYAVDVATGAIHWRAHTGGRIRGTPAVADGVVYVGAFDGRVYAFDLSTGARRWVYETLGATLNSGDYGFDRRSIQSSPAVANGVVCIGSRDGFVYAIDAKSGTLRWKYDHKISWINSSPAIADGVVYDGSSDGHFLQALDAESGHELWRTDLTSIVWSSPAVVGEHVLVGDGTGRLNLVDRKTGKPVGALRTGDRIMGSPIVVGNLAYIGSADGGVYAVRLSDGPAVDRAVFLDSTYVRAGAIGRSADVATYLVDRGYVEIGPAALATFLQVGIADGHPSVVVFATDHIPAALVTVPLDESLVRKYLDAGGKVVWRGSPPGLWSIDSAGQFPPLKDWKWDAPCQLLGVPHHAAIFDQRSVATTDVGMRWGLPRYWHAAFGVQPSGVTHVLALDDWGLAAAWVKSYGGRDGTGFVRVPEDDMLGIYLAAEYRPGDDSRARATAGSERNAKSLSQCLAS